MPIKTKDDQPVAILTPSTFTVLWGKRGHILLAQKRHHRREQEPKHKPHCGWMQEKWWQLDVCGLPKYELQNSMWQLPTPCIEESLDMLVGSQVFLGHWLSQWISPEGEGSRQQRQNDILYPIWPSPVSVHAIWPYNQPSDLSVGNAVFAEETFKLCSSSYIQRHFSTLRVLPGHLFLVILIRSYSKNRKEVGLHVASLR